MRPAVSTIQQTLTPDAAAVLNQAISDAARRNHGQTTPLHVAASLLSSPTGLLRQACVESHPNSLHPLQCRALELCFSVALERLPAAQTTSGRGEPQISNALIAALKRAAAQQRRGCPEQQQQPLLAVKVELHHLIISILDDPSVSRVMKEASFSSPAVKASIEQAHTVKPLLPSFIPNSSFSFRPMPPLAVPIPLGKNPYLNPKLQASSAAGVTLTNETGEEVKKVNDIMLRKKRRNPIILGESGAEQVVKEVLQCKEGMKVVDLENEVADKSALEELVKLWMRDLRNLKGIVINLGDLKWLVQQNSSFVAACNGNGLGGVATDAGKAVVAAVGKVVGESANVWLIGTATCDTFLRCQVYHPSMEGDWDLQAVSIGVKSRVSNRFEFPRPSSRLSIPEKVIGQTILKPKKTNLPEWLRVATSGETLATPNHEKDNAPVTTNLDLALGCPKAGGDNGRRKDFLGLDHNLKLLEASQNKHSNSFDVEFVKKLLKGLTEAVAWQHDAATAVASAIIKCKQGDGKRHRGDIWFLFSGPDKIGKWKMVNAISDLTSGVSPTSISFSTKTQKESERGKTALDRIADVVRKNPHSLLLLEDIDDGDLLLKNSIKRAIERGRISDSHGRQYSLGNCIFIITANWLPEESSLEEVKSAGDWHLRVSFSERSSKRPARWLLADRPIKHKKDMRSAHLFDLNEAAAVDDCSRAEESSDLTSEYEDEHTITINKFVPPSFSREIANSVEENIVFKPVEDNMRRDISSSINKKFASAMGDAVSVEIQEEALNRIVSGIRLGWFEFEEWSDRVLQPVISRLGLLIPSNTDSSVVRIETDNDYSTLHPEPPWSRGIGIVANAF